MSHQAISRAFIALAATVIASCHAPVDWSLAADEPNDRWGRLRQRQYLRTIDATGRLKELNLQPDQPDSDWASFRDELITECQSSRYIGSAVPGGVCDRASGGIHAIYCDVIESLCVANLLEEIAGITAEPIALGDPVTRAIPYQATATNAILHELAAREARRSLVSGLACLRNAATSSLDCNGTTIGEQIPGTDAGRPRYGRAFATAIVEALQLAEEATQKAVRDTLALADGHYSAAPTIRAASELATSAPIMSRAHAAHLLIGGAPGLAGTLPLAERNDPDAVFNTAFCTEPRLSARGEAALRIFREAALDPQFILNTNDVNIEQLLISNEWVFDATPHNVRSQLIRLHGLPEADLGSTAAEFADGLGLDIAAFVEARAHLIEEHRAFGRTMNPVYLPARMLAGGAVIDDLHAASGTAPTLPLPEYYATLARYDATAPSAYDAELGPFYAQRSLAHLRDYVYTHIRLLFQAADLLSSDELSSDELRSDILDPLAIVAQDADRVLPGRMVLWTRGGIHSDILPPPESQTWTNSWLIEGDGQSIPTHELVDSDTTLITYSSLGAFAYQPGQKLFGSLLVYQHWGAGPIHISLVHGMDHAMGIAFNHKTGEASVESGEAEVLGVEQPFPGWWHVTFEYAGSADAESVEFKVAPSAATATATGVVVVGGARLGYGRATGDFLAYLHNSTSEDDIVAVVGDDSLSCAVKGTIEAQPCRWDDVALLRLQSYGELPGLAGFERVAQFAYDEHHIGSRVYILRRETAAIELPGAYAAEVGVWLHASDRDGDPSGAIVVQTPATPDLSRQAGRILSPSTEWCAKPQVSCAGVDYDERMPLENELSEDGDAYESSWQYWLRLAGQAAQEADELGQQIIERGLSNDLRAEAAAAELEALCGGAVDLNGLARRDLSDAEIGSCNSASECDTGYLCNGGRCIRDPLQVLASLARTNPGAQRLNECLNAGLVHDYVALGTKNVCLWRATGSRNVWCQGAAPGQCPVASEAFNSLADCQALSGNHPPGAGANEWVFVDTKLGYFESDAPARTSTNAPPPCDALRAMRSSSLSSADFGALVQELSNGFFEPERLKSISRQIGWEAEVGDFSRMTLAGRPWGPNLGNPFTGPNMSGLPCAVGAEPICSAFGEAGDSLFSCRLDSCDDPVERARYNRRLLFAVSTARRLSWLGSDGISVFAHMPVHGGASLDNPSNDVEKNPDYLELWDPDVLEPDAVVTRRTAYDGQVFEWGDLWYQRRRAGQFGGSAGLADDAVSVPAYCVRTGTRPWTFFDQTGAHAAVAPCSRPIGCESCALSALFFVDMGHFYGPVGGDEYLDPYVLDALNTDFWAGLGGEPGRSGPGALYRLLQQSRGWAEPLRPADVGRISAPQGPVPWDPTVATVLDAVEVVCEAGRMDGSDCGEQPPSINSVNDISSAVRYLQCGADEIHRSAERVVLANVPDQALDALRRVGAVGAYPAVGGEYGRAMTELRGLLVELASVPPLIAHELRLLSNDVDSYRIALALLDNQRELNELRYASELSVQITTCISSALQSDWANPQSFGAGVAACANSVVQILIANNVRQIEQENAGIEESRQLLGFRDRFFTRLTVIQQHASRITQTLDAIDGRLGHLEQIRSAARNALSQALFLDSDPANVHATANSVMRRRYDLTRVRYERAREDAVRVAFLAKRAIEQRLGVSLSDMREDMALVEAPARWEARVCELSGIDYERLRDETELDIESFANEFIGDYVRRLERVVESYQVDYPFSDGRDTAVVSLRDDVHKARGLCETPVGNLLHHAGQLDQRTNLETGEPVWTIVGCREAAGGGVEPNCLSVAGLLPDERENVEPFPLAHQDLSAVRAFRVSFGPPDGTWVCSPGSCGMTEDTALQQELDLPAGRYRLSWYGAPVLLSPLDPRLAVEVRGAVTGARLTTSPPSASTSGVGLGWTRYWYVFDADGSEPVQVRVVPAVNVGSPPEAQRVDLAGLMLEDMSGRIVSPGTGSYNPVDFPPGVFQNTGDRLTRLARTCPDETGQEFRARNWRRNCLRLCAEGFGRECPNESADLYCYWETSFTITQRDIERGRTFTSAGFARGNYNYRIDSIALNIVGTGVRDCSEVAHPESCYAGGFVPYTIEHVGPYTVRNVRGEDYEARLFTARIEHARALASERYLTNPLSSSDTAKIEDYKRRELRGRPLDGTYVLRIWDEAGVNFQGIEDVQVMLGYRYWTRSL